MDTANIQFGIWVAAWHERMRSIIALWGGTDKIIMIPVIQVPVVGGIWTLLFVMDAGAEIGVLGGNFRIGDTDSILAFTSCKLLCPRLPTGPGTHLSPGLLPF
ncbi:hypothetical protein BGZ61DRAFT_577826 [Ilyonectria robusta]|uniref:uncharacterized protein n=1 Tax=Ilyonectria robusta TaxID=1079257 RepID=UPI001E8E3E6C|nr:uncharacterized protein BGZ61DRAFT_577826 [Ilyonectria robusta]KAH8650693.1 hypothetical protein BGZ61DRAFT_577826 [Ilyonectria robusta]